MIILQPVYGSEEIWFAAYTKRMLTSFSFLQVDEQGLTVWCGWCCFQHGEACWQRLVVFVNSPS